MKMPHSPKPWSYLEPPRQPVPSENDLPMIVSDGGGIIARLRACANPRMTFNDPSLPDVGDVPEYRDGWALGFDVARTNGQILGMALEMADAIVEWAECDAKGIDAALDKLADLAARLRALKGAEP